MWKFEVRDISDFHYRQLSMLVRFELAEAHIVVRRCKGVWPQTRDITDRRAPGIPRGQAIN